MLTVDRSFMSAASERPRQLVNFSRTPLGRCNFVRFRIALHVPRARLEGNMGPHFPFEICSPV